MKYFILGEEWRKTKLERITSVLVFLILGITGQGQQSNSTQSCNPLGLGLNLNALPVNPALVAAALNQAGWGLIGSLQNQPEPNFNQGFNNPPNSSNGMYTLIF